MLCLLPFLLVWLLAPSVLLSGSSCAVVVNAVEDNVEHHPALPVIGAREQCGNSTTYCRSSNNKDVKTCCHAPFSPTGYGCSMSGQCCKPGPRDPPSSSLPNCLILGDSVSIGYAPAVARALEGACQVQHGPWDVSDGGAGSAAEGLACLENFLVTQGQARVPWDAVAFNFGLHDLDDASAPSRAAYRRALTAIAQRLKETGAELIYALTTPYMPDALVGNRIVDELNDIARGVMLDEGVQQIVDLNALVHQRCGSLYESCDWCETDPCGYHYNDAGKFVQGLVVADAIREALDAEGRGGGGAAAAD